MDGERERRLGVDIGRVIIDGGTTAVGGGEDTAFVVGGEKAALATPPVAGAFDALALLVGRFDGRVWLVSKCGERVEARTRAWLVHHRFHERTGVPADHVRFCRERADKAIHCRELGITDFVDDRPDVLGHLRGVVERRYLFGPQEHPIPADVVATRDWSAVLAAVAPSPP
jgi:hypothetical protein